MGNRILLVEDDPSVRELLKVLLESEGYEILEAKDGLEGLLKAEFVKPDLLILDLMMPDVDGERVLAQIRSDEELASIPVLVVSGKYEAINRVKDLIGDDNVFPKPFEPTKLLDRIGDLIGHPDDGVG
ncbi:MAG: PleD family two-component system response regulator [Actinomycetota bacterium]|nr:response regulator [Actinomycetota bacterium]